MAKTDRKDTLKRFALIGFVAVNVVLVLLILADGTVVREDSAPSFYRDTTFDADNYSLLLTETALANDFMLTQGIPTHTPEPHDGGQGNGAGSGGGNTGGTHDDATPTP